ncbi:MAG: hypothetical protein RLZZ28_689 [Bacteroidota bacterium]|jgi:DNA-binding response OmpR family regulator
MNETSILLVEDEPKIAHSLKKGLEENDYSVDIAFDGVIGKKMFYSGSYDLIILDINLPQVNGYELCRIIRSRQPDIPIIMLTAMGSIDDKVEGFQAGTDDYLVKPFEFKELQVRISALLKRTANPAAGFKNVLKVGELELNLDSKEVIRSGKQISLTAKEFQLLEYLMKNQNKVVSRGDIAYRVWDIDFDTKTNVIDVYMNYLRNKVDKPFSHKMIHTMVGMGYVLKEA